MELDSRKESRCDSMMRSKSFETQELREIGWKEAGESRGFSILWMEIIKDVIQIKGRECKDQEKLKMCIENPCQSKEDALAWNRQLCRASGSGGGKVCGNHKKFSGGEGGAKGRVRLLRACSSAELRKVASGFAMQDLWLGDRKVRSQVISKDQSQLQERNSWEN